MQFFLQQITSYLLVARSGLKILTNPRETMLHPFPHMLPPRSPRPGPIGGPTKGTREDTVGGPLLAQLSYGPILNPYGLVLGPIWAHVMRQFVQRPYGGHC